MQNLIELSIRVPTDDNLHLAQDTAHQAASLQVTTVAESAGAQHLRSAINYKMKALEEQRIEMKRPLMDHIKKLDAMYAAPREIMERALKVIDMRLVAFNAKLEAARLANQAKENDRAEAERARLLKLSVKAEDAGKNTSADVYASRADMVVANVVALPEVKVEGTSFRDVWKFRVRDASKINPAFLMPDETKIGGVVKSMHLDAEGIVGEGLEVYREQIVVSRRA